MHRYTVNGGSWHPAPLARRVVALGVATVLAVVVFAVIDAAAPTVALDRSDTRAQAVIGVEVPVDDDVSYEIRAAQSGYMRLHVIDRSGRDVTSAPPFDSGIRPPTTTERRYPVEILWPVDSAGTRRPGPHPLVVHGMYRIGADETQGCSPGQRVGHLEVCVGFHFADVSSPQFADAVNMAGDLSVALDVLLSDPGAFGAIDTEHIVYSGVSLGGIVGFLLLHPALRDTRLTAMMLLRGFVPFWIPAFAETATWRAAPPILYTAATQDEVLPYELTRRSVALARPASRFTLISELGLRHFDPPCAPAVRYALAWRRWQLGLTPRPAKRVRLAMKNSTCAAFGLVPGGTTGFGAAAPLVPPGTTGRPTS